MADQDLLQPEFTPEAVPQEPTANLTDLIYQTAEQEKVPGLLAHRLVHQESKGNPNAVSPKGAMGLLQLMPGTAAKLGVTDPFDPVTNLRAGLRMLRENYEKYGNWGAALVAHNAGEKDDRVRTGEWANEAYQGYNETRGFIKNILGPTLGSRIIGQAQTGMHPYHWDDYAEEGSRAFVQPKANPVPAPYMRDNSSEAKGLTGLEVTTGGQFDKMAQEFMRRTNGVPLHLNSGHRTKEHQAELRAEYDAAVARGENPSPVGTVEGSRHPQGLAIDLNKHQVRDPRYNALIVELLDKYGFHRPVKGEDWHIELKDRPGGKEAQYRQYQNEQAAYMPAEMAVNHSFYRSGLDEATRQGMAPMEQFQVPKGMPGLRNDPSWWNDYVQPIFDYMGLGNRQHTADPWQIDFDREFLRDQTHPAFDVTESPPLLGMQGEVIREGGDLTFTPHRTPDIDDFKWRWLTNPEGRNMSDLQAFLHTFLFNEARSIGQRYVSGLTGGLSDVALELVGGKSEAASVPAQLGEKGAQFAGEVMGPFKLGHKLMPFQGSRYAPVWAELDALTKGIGEQTISMALALPIAGLVRNMQESKDGYSLLKNIAGDAKSGAIFGLTYGGLGAAVDNDVTRMGVSLVLGNYLRAPEGRYTTLDDIVTGLADGSLSKRQLANEFYNAIFDMYFGKKAMTRGQMEDQHNTNQALAQAGEFWSWVAERPDKEFHQALDFMAKSREMATPMDRYPLVLENQRLSLTTEADNLIAKLDDQRQSGKGISTGDMTQLVLEQFSIAKFLPPHLQGPYARAVRDAMTSSNNRAEILDSLKGLHEQMKGDLDARLKEPRQVPTKPEKLVLEEEAKPQAEGEAAPEPIAESPTESLWNRTVNMTSNIANAIVGRRKKPGGVTTTDIDNLVRQSYENDRYRNDLINLAGIKPGGRRGEYDYFIDQDNHIFQGELGNPNLSQREYYNVLMRHPEVLAALPTLSGKRIAYNLVGDPEGLWERNYLDKLKVCLAIADLPSGAIRKLVDYARGVRENADYDGKEAPVKFQPSKGSPKKRFTPRAIAVIGDGDTPLAQDRMDAILRRAHDKADRVIVGDDGTLHGKQIVDTAREVSGEELTRFSPQGEQHPVVRGKLVTREHDTDTLNASPYSDEVPGRFLGKDRQNASDAGFHRSSAEKPGEIQVSPANLSSHEIELPGKIELHTYNPDAQDTGTGTHREQLASDQQIRNMIDSLAAEGDQGLLVATGGAKGELAIKLALEKGLDVFRVNEQGGIEQVSNSKKTPDNTNLAHAFNAPVVTHLWRNISTLGIGEEAMRQAKAAAHAAKVSLEEARNAVTVPTSAYGKLASMYFISGLGQRAKDFQLVHELLEPHAQWGFNQSLTDFVDAFAHPMQTGQYDRVAPWLQEAVHVYTRMSKALWKDYEDMNPTMRGKGVEFYLRQQYSTDTDGNLRIPAVSRGVIARYKEMNDAERPAFIDSLYRDKRYMRVLTGRFERQAKVCDEKNQGYIDAEKLKEERRQEPDDNITVKDFLHNTGWQETKDIPDWRTAIALGLLPSNTNQVIFMRNDLMSRIRWNMEAAVVSRCISDKNNWVKGAEAHELPLLLKANPEYVQLKGRAAEVFRSIVEDLHPQRELEPENKGAAPKFTEDALDNLTQIDKAMTSLYAERATASAREIERIDGLLASLGKARQEMKDNPENILVPGVEPTPQLTMPREFVAHPDVAVLLNRMFGESMWDKRWYRATRPWLDMVRSLQVGFSAFHAMMITKNVISQGTGEGLVKAMGAVFTNQPWEDKKAGVLAGLKRAGDALLVYPEMKNIIGSSQKELANWYKNPELAPMLEDYVNSGGRLPDKAAIEPFVKGLVEAYGNIKGSDRSALEKFRDMVAWPIMTYLVPLVKLGSFLKMRERVRDEVDAKFANHPSGPDTEMLREQEYLKATQQIHNHLDNIHGQMVYDNMPLSRWTRDMLFIGMNYPGWSIGSYRWMGEAFKGSWNTAKDLLKGDGLYTFKNDRDARQAMTYMVGMLAQMAIYNGLMTIFMNGDAPDLQDIMVGPRTGYTMNNGAPERLRTAGYDKEVLSGLTIINPLNWSSGKSLQEVGKLINSKELFAITQLKELMANVDRMGHEIVDPEAGVFTQWKQRFKYLGKAAMPITVQNLPMFGGGHGIKSTALRYGGFVGLQRAGKEFSGTPMTDQMDRYFESNAGRMLLEKDQPRRDVRDAVYDAIDHRDMAGAQRLMMDAFTHHVIDQNQFNNLQKDIMLHLGDPLYGPMRVRYNKVNDLEAAIKIYAKGDKVEQQTLRPLLIQKFDRATPEIQAKNVKNLMEAMRR